MNAFLKWNVTVLGSLLLMACNPQQLPQVPEKYERKTSNVELTQSPFLKNIEQTPITGWTLLHMDMQSSIYVNPDAIQIKEQERRALLVRLASNGQIMIIQNLTAFDCTTPGKSLLAAADVLDFNTKSSNPMIIDKSEWDVSPEQSVGRQVWKEICGPVDALKSSSFPQPSSNQPPTTFGGIADSMSHYLAFEERMKQVATQQDISSHLLLNTSYGAVAVNASNAQTLGNLRVMDSFVFFRQPQPLKENTVGYMFVANGYLCQTPGAYHKIASTSYDENGNMLILPSDPAFFNGSEEKAPIGTDAYTLWTIACEKAKLPQSITIGTRASDFYKTVKSSSPYVLPPLPEKK